MAPPEPAAPPQAPEGYRLQRKLGAGAMGEVFLAQRERDGLPVAIKFLAPELSREPEVLARFRREAQAQASVRHPNLVAVLDVSLEPPAPCLVLEFVDGQDLEAYLRTRAPLAAAEVLRLGRGLAGALDALHGAGVIHRDIKPANLMVRRDGEPVVMDLGLARVEDSTVLTRTGALVGTPRYLSPEAMRGQPATRASDQYQLALVLREALTGEVAVPGNSLEEVAGAIAAGARTPAPDLAPESRRLLPVLERGAAVEPEARFPSCQALLEALADPSRPAAPPPTPPPTTATAPVSPGALSEAHAPLPGEGLRGPRGLPGLLAITCFLGALLFPWAPGPPEGVRWEVIGTSVRISCRPGAPKGLQLELGGRRIPPEDTPEGPRFLVRDLTPGTDYQARLVWEGGQGPRTTVRTEPPAVDPVLELRPPRRVGLRVHRPVQVAWAPAPPGRDLPPGASELDPPVGLLQRPVELRWREAGLEFRRTWTPEEVWRPLLEDLHRTFDDLDPQPFLVARTARRDRSGDGFEEERRTWRALAGWLPDLLQTLPRGEARWLWDTWQRWALSAAQETALGDPADPLQVPAEGPGWRPTWDRSETPAPGWQRVDVPLEILEGRDLHQDGSIELVTESAKRLVSTMFRDAARGAGFAWPALEGEGPVLLLGEWDELRHHNLAQLRCDEPGGTRVLGRVWVERPTTTYDEKARGWMGLLLPEVVLPAPGTPCRIEVQELLNRVPTRNHLVRIQLARRGRAPTSP